MARTALVGTEVDRRNVVARSMITTGSPSAVRGEHRIQAKQVDRVDLERNARDPHVRMGLGSTVLRAAQKKKTIKFNPSP